MKVTISAIVHESDYGDGVKIYSLRDRPFTSECTVPMGPYTFEYDVPEGFNPVPLKLAALEREKQAARAAYTERLNEINDRISKLQAIEYTPEAA